MTPDIAVDLMLQAIQLVLVIVAVLVVPGLLVGLLVSLFQAATQINEATLTFIPKLLGVFLTLLIAGPWMLSVMTDYIRAVFTNIPTLAG